MIRSHKELILFQWRNLVLESLLVRVKPGAHNNVKYGGLSELENHLCVNAVVVHRGTIFEVGKLHSIKGILNNQAEEGYREQDG